jgi:hypothetical protein
MKEFLSFADKPMKGRTMVAGYAGQRRASAGRK